MNRLCVINQHTNKIGQVKDAFKQCSLHFPPTDKLRKEKENDLAMTSRWRINYIHLLPKSDLLISYHATTFDIIPLVFPYHQLDRPPALYHNYYGCRKGAHLLQSCREY